MKILVNTLKNGKDHKLISYQVLSNSPSENSRYLVIDAEYLPYREGFYQELAWNEDKEVFEFIYVKKPESQEDIMMKKIAEQQKKITELTLYLAKKESGASQQQEELPEPPDESDDDVEIKPSISKASHRPDITETGSSEIPSEQDNNISETLSDNNDLTNTKKMLDLAGSLDEMEDPEADIPELPEDKKDKSNESDTKEP